MELLLIGIEEIVRSYVVYIHSIYHPPPLWCAQMPEVVLVNCTVNYNCSMACCKTNVSSFCTYLNRL